MNSLRVLRIDHVAIDVTNVDRAKDFYGRLLGLREIPRPASFTFGGAWYEIGGDVLHLVSRAVSYPPLPHHFCFRVEDVESAANLLEKAGYPVMWDTRFKIPGVERLFTRDPDGNRVEFQGEEPVLGE